MKQPSFALLLLGAAGAGWEPRLLFAAAGVGIAIILAGLVLQIVSPRP